MTVSRYDQKATTDRMAGLFTRHGGQIVNRRRGYLKVQSSRAVKEPILESDRADRAGLSPG